MTVEGVGSVYDRLAVWPKIMTVRSFAASRHSVESAVLWMAWGGLASLLVIGGRSHIPWFDEAQGWLIARDSNPLEIVGHVVRYEGTPALWHLCLWVLQRLGLQYAQFYLVSAGLALAGGALVLFRSPFPVWARIGIVFSYFFCFQYAIVARSYALDLLLIPLVATNFQYRFERPIAYSIILGLLANTNAHSFVMAIPLALELAWSSRRTAFKDKRTAMALCIYGVLALFAAYQAWPPRDPNFASAGGVQLMAARPVILLLEGIIERANFISDPGVGLHVFPTGMLLTLLVLIPVGFLAFAAKKPILCVALPGCLLLFMLFVYSNYWHSGAFFLALLLCLWICWDALPRLRSDRRKWLIGAIVVLLSYQDSYSVAAWARDLRHPYSAGKAAAAALAELQVQRPHDRIAAAGFKTFAVQPFLPRNPFANAPAETTGAFFRWRRHGDVPLFVSLADWTQMVSSHHYDWLLLSPDNPAHDLRLAPYTDRARAGGYCIAKRFRGDLVWKTRLVEPDDLILFGRCARPGVASSISADLAP